MCVCVCVGFHDKTRLKSEIKNILLDRVNVSLSFSEKIECLPQPYPKLHLFKFRI